jgi:hypothetical protein
MALQSAALLCSHLLGEQPAARAPGSAAQAAQVELQRRYAADWRRQFAPRLRLAATFAHVAMRPRSADLLMALVRRWPGLLTSGARWGGKVRPMRPAQMPATVRAAHAAPALESATASAIAPQLL